MSEPDAGSRVIDYLSHMLDAVRLSRSYVEGMEKSDFRPEGRDLYKLLLTAAESLVFILQSVGTLFSLEIESECASFHDLLGVELNVSQGSLGA